jgi:hypothetical protein
VLENVLNDKTNNRENMKKQILFCVFPINDVNDLTVST